MKGRPKSDLKLVFKDDTGVKHKSNKFKNGDLVHWNFDMSVHLLCNCFRRLIDSYRYVRSPSNVTLTIRLLGTLFKKRIGEISVEFELNEFALDNGAVGLEFKGLSVYL